MYVRRCRVRSKDLRLIRSVLQNTEKYERKCHETWNETQKT